MPRSPYLRDRIDDLPLFRDRGRPLPMRPEARCSKATAAQLPERDRAAELTSRGLPAFLAAVPPVRALDVHFDDSIPDGIIEIDGMRIPLAELVAATEGP